MAEVESDIEGAVRALVSDTGDVVLGFADLGGLLSGDLASYRSGIVIGRRLNDRVIDSIASGPNIEYYRLYNETNRQLSEIAGLIASELLRLGVRARVIDPTVGNAEVVRIGKEFRYPFSHKMVATRAGLGWIGKTDLLVSKRFGPRLRLATVLLERPLDSSATPIDESRCGECEICVSDCPAQAANGKSWNVDVYRNEFYDPVRCMKKCVELSMKRVRRPTTICGICVSVCPRGKTERTDIERERKNDETGRSDGTI